MRSAIARCFTDPIYEWGNKKTKSFRCDFRCGARDCRCDANCVSCDFSDSNGDAN
jgi:hypothetical protein